MLTLFDQVFLSFLWALALLGLRPTKIGDLASSKGIVSFTLSLVVFSSFFTEVFEQDPRWGLVISAGRMFIVLFN